MGTISLVAGFFLYTGEYDAADGAPKGHNEIDVEFVWGAKRNRPSSGPNRTIIQTNFFTDGKGGNKEMYTPEFEVSSSSHRYGIKWTSKSVTFFIDGKVIRHVDDGSTPVLEETGSLKLFTNLWSVADDNLDTQSWAGGVYQHDDNNPPELTVDWISFSKGEDCSIAPSRRRR